MKTAHIIFKTHLDIGFTDLGKNVLDHYNNTYIPNAIKTANEMNNSKRVPQFIWTTGAYLIWQYLETQNEKKVNEMEQAIKSGYIKWHGLAATFHTEAAGEFIFNESFKYSKELDKRFGFNTISGKMTDVPGHTKASIPILAKNNIKFLHLGMNAVSKIPSVPDNFIWRNGEDEVYVSYSKGYGDEVIIDGMDDIMIFAHTHDNSGPQSVNDVQEVINKIQNQYPDYEVRASTMDEFTKKLIETKPKLPIVDEEIGDTWIHGIGSDPLKMSEYYKLVELTEKWIKNGDLSVNDDKYLEYLSMLMLVPEHTWGMDIKRYLSDYKNYTKEDFQIARLAENITDHDLTFRYQDIAEDTKKEMKYTSFEWTDRSYKLIESSWNEQREYIDKAIELLPTNLQQIATERFENNKNELNNIEVITPHTKYIIKDYEVEFGASGEIIYLKKNDIQYAEVNNSIGMLSYTVYGNDSYENYRAEYLRDLDRHSWAVDFLRPGIELQNEVIKTETYTPVVTSMCKADTNIIVNLKYPTKATTKYGAPKEVIITYSFENELKIKISLSNKDAIRYAESISLQINPITNNPARYTIQKLGQYISPLDIVGGGNKVGHVLDNSIKYDAIDRKFKIEAVDNRLIFVGQDNILDYNDHFPKIENGFYFCLYNNIWGTNFRLWYEDDISATYKIKFE